MPAKLELIAPALFLVALASPATAQIPGLGAAAPAKSAAEPAPAKPAAPDAIPLAEIAVRAMQIKLTLRALDNTMPGADDLRAMEEETRAWESDLGDKRRQVDEFLRLRPTSIELRELRNYWDNARAGTAARKKQATTWAEGAQKALSRLDELGDRWAVSLKTYQSDATLQPIFELILDSLRTIRDQQKEALDTLLAAIHLQVVTTQQDQAAADVVARLSREQSATGLLFSRDSAPLWAAGSGDTPSYSIAGPSWSSVQWSGLLVFGEDHKASLTLLVLTLLFSLWATRQAYRRAAKAKLANQAQELMFLILNRWVALGMAVPLLFFCLLLPRAPTPLIGIVILLWCFPIYRLLPAQAPHSTGLVKRAVLLYSGYALFVLLSPSSLHSRRVSFAMTCVALLCFADLVRPARIRTGWQANRRVVTEVLAVLAALGISAVANFFGYVRLAQFIKVSFIYATFIAIGVFATIRTYTMLLVEAVDTPFGQRLALVRLHRKGTLKWLPRLLNWFGFGLWMAAVLDLLGVRNGLITAIGQGLAVTIGPSSSLTVGSVFNVLLILTGGYLFARAVRFLLREEVLSRFSLPRGIPELMASGVFYVLLMIFVVSASSAGSIDWSKLTLFTGAIGVGVGFGLQNILSNFISGLILQFERPVKAGDMVELEGQTGIITRIGIRSSTIRTFQGAEVVMPNANFISNRVTNWTLSEEQRRVEIPIGVAYGSRPERVSELLLGAANNHERVLIEPAPVAYFQGFGESSMNFELWFWILKTNSLPEVRSEVALAVMKAFEESGIEIPFPQRDLYVHHVATSAEAAVRAEVIPDPK